MPLIYPILSDCPPNYPAQKFSSLESDGTRLIYINGQLIFCLQLADELTCRHAAVQLYQCWRITQKEIAPVFGVTVRTINTWIGKYRADGIEGLKTKTAGAPLKVSSEIESKICRMRQAKKKVSEICHHLGIGKSRVYQVLNAHKEEQDELPLGSLDSSSAIVDGHIDIDKDCLSEELNHSEDSASIDPMDRSLDRLCAQLGLIDDASPVFAEADQVEWAGAFLAVAMLSQGHFFNCIRNVYLSIGPAFYGLGNVLMTLFLMAVLRIKNPEQLNQCNPQKLGRILGLDRAPSVKTLRRKIKTIASRRQGINLMNLLGKERVEEANLPDAVLYLDGHVQCYYGKGKLGKTFSTTKNRALKANTDYWVNLADGTPILCIPTQFNQSMSSILPSIVLHAQKLCKNRRITIVFDRAGSSAATFEKLIALNCDFIAYNKNPKDIDKLLFKQQKTVINGKNYDYAPYEQELKMPIYQKNSRGQYRKTKRILEVREIIILRKDGGQTHIVSSRTDIESVCVAATLFKRWTQENFFKYLSSMYDFDHILTYQMQKMSSTVDHPNPEHVQLSKTIKSLRQRIGQILGGAFEKLTDNQLAEPVNRFRNLHSGKKAKELDKLLLSLKKTKQVLKMIPERENLEKYQCLEPESRLIGNIIKMTAYHVEGKLADILKNYWRGINGNERGILSGFLQSTGAITLNGNTITITLEKQSTPLSTHMLKRLCDDMTVTAARYPGTNLRMIFDVAK
jgi:transposase